MSDKIGKNLALTGLCLGFFMIIIDVTVINVALPSISHTFQASVSNLQWIVAGYTLTFACFLLFAGTLADLVGAKRVLLIGLFLFIIMSCACAFAPTINYLILFRLLQGAAATTLVPCSLVLINATYENMNDRAKAIGIWGGIAGIAAAFGPLLGAILTAEFGWPAIFIINVPIGLIAIFFVTQFVNYVKPQLNTRFDILGLLFSIIMLASLAFSLIEAGRFGWSSHIVITALLTAITGFIIFFWIEKHIQYPMLNLQFFKIKNFSISIIIGMLINFGFYGLLFILPLYFQNIRGYNVMQTGFAILPLSILVAVGSYLCGKLISHKGTKIPLILGLLIATFGFFSLLIIKAQTPNYLFLILPLACVGFGLSFVMPAATIIAMHAVPKAHAGMASSSFTTSRQLGSLFGVAVFGSILASAVDFVQGIHFILKMTSILFFLGFVLFFFTYEKK